MPLSRLAQLLGWSSHPRSMHHDQWLVESRRRLLPVNNDEHIVPAIPPADVTKLSLRLRRLVEECVPCEVEDVDITKSHSRIITSRVINAAKAAADDKTRACVVFCLLVNKRWFAHQALLELWDADLHGARALACEIIAKNIIENEPDFHYLVHHVLLKRYSILVDSEPTPPCNAVEKAVDLHALHVICSSGYQKTMSQLWKGWLVQADNDPTSFVEYADRDNVSFRKHLHPDRIRAPMYQNTTQMLISFIYLTLYTNAINSQQAGGDFDVVEGILYVFTLGFICDELSKIWKVGWQIVGFWNALNFCLYTLLSVSFALRCIALSHGNSSDDELRLHFSKLSYSFLAVTAPLFWIRLLLYLDTFRFFGAMLVVLKTMMAESVIFFALLFIICIGFYQAFLGLDWSDDQVAEDTVFIIQSMANALMQSPDFAGFEKFQHPFGLVLYYSFTFIVMVVLLNVLIALYGAAYSDVYENANDEYLAVCAKKTLLFVRAPDENVFIPPFNLIEMVFLVALLEWWVDRRLYQRINDYVMAIIYSPLLLVSACIETRMAVEIRAARARGAEDDDTLEEWEQMASEVDFDADGWNSKVDMAKSNLEEEPAVLEVRQLRGEITELRDMIEKLHRLVADGGKSNAD